METGNSSPEAQVNHKEIFSTVRDRISAGEVVAVEDFKSYLQAGQKVKHEEAEKYLANFGAADINHQVASILEDQYREALEVGTPESMAAFCSLEAWRIKDHAQNIWTGGSNLHAQAAEQVKAGYWEDYASFLKTGRKPK